MPMSLLYEWLAFYKQEPFGSDVERWRIGEYQAFARNSLLISSLLNAQSGKYGRKFRWDQFIPENIKAQFRQKKSPQEIYQAFKHALGLIGVRPSKVEHGDD